MISQSSQRLPDLAGAIKRALRIGGGVNPSVQEGIVPTMLVWDATDPEFSSRHYWTHSRSLVGDATHTGFVAIGNFSDHHIVIDAAVGLDSTGAAVMEMSYAPQFDHVSPDFTKAVLRSSVLGVPGANLEQADRISCIANAAASGSGQLVEASIIGASTQYRFLSVPIILGPRPTTYGATQADSILLWVTSNTHTTWWTVVGHYDP